MLQPDSLQAYYSGPLNSVLTLFLVLLHFQANLTPPISNHTSISPAVLSDHVQLHGLCLLFTLTDGHQQT